MSERIEETIKLLVEEGRTKGFLSYADMNRLLEEQFIPPDSMDQVFIALEDNGIDVVEEGTAGPTEHLPARPAVTPARPPVRTQSATAAVRGVMPEKIDDPVRMYLTQMGEIPLLSRDRGDLRSPRRSS